MGELSASRVGVRVHCAACGRMKQPRGRSTSPEAANGYCGWDCPGYDAPPHVGSLWPGESEADFGWPVGKAGTATPQEGGTDGP